MMHHSGRTTLPSDAPATYSLCLPPLLREYTLLRILEVPTKLSQPREVIIPVCKNPYGLTNGRERFITFIISSISSIGIIIIITIIITK